MCLLLTGSAVADDAKKVEEADTVESAAPLTPLTLEGAQRLDLEGKSGVWLTEADLRRVDEWRAELYRRRREVSEVDARLGETLKELKEVDDLLEDVRAQRLELEKERARFEREQAERANKRARRAEAKAIFFQVLAFVGVGLTAF